MLYFQGENPDLPAEAKSVSNTIPTEHSASE